MSIQPNNPKQAELERQKQAFIQKLVEIQRKQRKEKPKPAPRNSR